MRKRVYFAIFAACIVLIAALAVYVLFIYPNFTAMRSTYKRAQTAFGNNAFIEAAMGFDSIAGYSDAAERAKDSWKKAAQAAADAGDIDRASAYLLRANASADELESLNETYFNEGEQSYLSGDMESAELYFSCISDKSKYTQRIDELRISYAMTLLESADYTRADRALALCSPQLYERICGIWFDHGVDILGDWDVAGAGVCFNLAKAYSDGDSSDIGARINAAWNEAGQLAMAAKEYTIAELCFEMSENSDVSIDSDRDEGQYNDAVECYNNGEYLEALTYLRSISPGYKDSGEMIAEIESKLRRMLGAGGETFYATLNLDGTIDFQLDWGEYSAPGWSNIQSISVGRSRFMLGLRENGTVAAAGNSNYGSLNVGDWTGIIQIACGEMHSLGLKSDGSVVSCGRNYYGQTMTDASGWDDIVYIAAGYNASFGVRDDGTVIAIGNNTYGQCNVSAWSDITAVASGYSHTVGLKSNGTVVAVGNNSYGQCNVTAWTDIVAVWAGEYHTIGLKSDGTLVACGSNQNGECNVQDYRNVLAASAGAKFTLIMLEDGTVVTLGIDDDQ